MSDTPPSPPPDPPERPPRQDRRRTDVADSLLLMFGRIAGLILVVSVALVPILALLRPKTDLTPIGNMLSTSMSLILGAILGYIARPPKDRNGTG